MKKEYIIPETAVHSIEIENMVCMSTHDEVGDGQLSKEYGDDDGDYWD